MKVITPEISWHERDPIYSIDFQPGKWPIQRIASGGVDKIVRIWQMTLDAEGKGHIDFLANLRRHTATINAVRFSKNGELLATAGDDSAIILWKLSDVPTPANNIFAEDDAEEDKESWVCHKTLRGHLGDVADLCWSKDNRYLVSASVDNCAIVWDVVKDVKVAIFNEHKSYVQGVAFDPLGVYVATLSADRSMRLYNLNSKNCVHNVSKMTLPSHLTPTPTAQDSSSAVPETKPKPFRIFHDDSLRSFSRRLEFSPDGQLLFAPAGCMEIGDSKVVNASFIFARGAFSKPAVYLPSVEKTTTVARVNPQLFHLRPVAEDTSAPENDNRDEWEKHKSLFCLPYRVVFAVATEDSVLIYDTQQTMPIGLLKNIHYSQISDMSWTSDGRALIVASTDGFCTIATFEDGELGTLYKAPASVTKEEKTDLTYTSLVKDPPKLNGKDEEEESPQKSSGNALLPFAQYSEEKACNGVKKTNSPATQQKKTPGSKDRKAAEKPPSTSSAKKHLDQKMATTKDDGPVVSQKSELADHVSTMKITENEGNKTNKDNTEQGFEHNNQKTINEQEKGVENNEVQKEAPKKKRIQITTLSLNKK